MKVASHIKNKAFIEWQNDPFSVSKRDKLKTLQANVQSERRQMQDKWWEVKAAQVQLYAGTHNAKKFFSSLKTVLGSSASGCSPLLSSDWSTLIKHQEELSKRWQEHFSNLLNRPSSVDADALNQIPQQPMHDSLTDPPTMGEIEKAICQTNSGRASGKNGIPAEIYKTAGPNALQAFHDVLLRIWEEEKMPDDFRNALIVSLYKNKGSKSDCGNYSGLSLRSITKKIFARVILNRLIQVSEKSIEQNMPLYSVFIVLAKAFDSVNREALCVGLERTGCPPKFISMIRLFHDGMTGQVLSSGNVTEAFAISNGMKRGCVLAPVFFNVLFTCMLSHAVRDLEKGLYIRYRLDGSLFDLRRLTAKTKRLQTLLQVVLFGECALVAHTETDLQRMIDRFLDASKLFALTVSLEKTKVLHQPAPNTHPPAPTIVIDDTTFTNVEHFKYLGSTISCDGSLDKELGTRIGNASQALGRLRIEY